MRLAPRPLRLFFNGLPPEIGVRGHKRSHETKWSSDGNAEVRADLRQDDLRGVRPNPVDAGEVDASESPEGGPCRLLPTRFDGFLLGRTGVSGNRVLLPLGRLKGLELLQQPRLIRGGLRVQRVEEPERGREVEEMLVAPIPREVLGDLFGRLRTARVVVRAERDGIAFARHDGTDDGHPGRPREVGDRAMHLDVHLVQGLLHPLDTPRALGHGDWLTGVARLSTA